jgi:ABC-type transport system substrate-binding protein
MKRIIYLFVIIASLAMILPACAPAQPIQLHPVKGAFLEAQLGESAQTLNWIIATDQGASKRYASFMVEPLAVFNNQYKLQLRCLAKDVEVSNDGLVYTVTIRNDLKWSDGTKVTAEDYVYTLKNIMLADWLDCAERPNWVEVIAGDTVGVHAEVVSDYVFKIVRRTVDPNFAYSIYDLMPYPRGIVRNYENKAEDFTAAPELNNMSYCGNMGPYRPTDWTTTDGFIMVRNPTYYLASDNGAPYFEKYTIIQMGLQSEINEALSAGKISYTYIEPQDANTFRNNKDLNVVTVPTGQFLMVAYNQRDNGWAGLKDSRVRQAISMVIDKPAVVNDIFGGYADAAFSFIPPYSPWYNESVLQKFGLNSSGDAGKAVDLIKGAGYEMKDVDGKPRFVDKDGKPITLIIPIAIDSEVQKSVAYIIGQNLRSIGLDLEPRYQVQDFIAKEIFVNKLPGSDKTPEYNSGPGAVSSQPWDMVILSSYGDALTVGRSEIFFSSTGRLNVFGFYNEKVDALYKRAMSAEAINPQSRQKIYDELAKAISDAQPVDLLVYYKDNFAYRSNIRGIEPGYNLLSNYQFWYAE